MAEGGSDFRLEAEYVGPLVQGDNSSQTNYIYNFQPSPPSASKELDFLPVLRRLDRSPQVEKLKLAVNSARWPRRSRPLVIVLDGRPEDELLSLVQRLNEYEFKKKMKLPCDFLGMLEWPTESVSSIVFELLDAISCARGEEIPIRSAADRVLAKAIRAHERTLAFALRLDPRSCRRDILSEWANLLTTTFRNPSKGLLICFLCVQRRERGADWLDVELQSLAGRHGWCVVDSALPVSSNDVEDWASLYNVEPLPILDRIDPEIAKVVFQDRSSLTYREAMNRVLSALSPQIKPHEQKYFS